MVGTITFDTANNVITAVGGTSGAPIGFVDLYNADVAGSRTLKGAAASPFTASLTTPIKPCESLALKLSLVVTLFSVAGTVALNGKDAWGNAQTETLNITGNGTVVSTKYYSSIDANGVVALGTFTVAVNQPRWGVVWKQAAAQYAFDGKIALGDGSTATFFADNQKQIIFTAVSLSADAQFYFDVKANATFTSGILISSPNKTTKNGCQFFFNMQANWGKFGASSASGIFNAYSCSFQAYYDTYIERPKSYWNNFHGERIAFDAPISTTDIYNFMSTYGTTGVRSLPTGSGTVTQCVIVGAWSQAMWHYDANQNETIKNIYMRQCAKVYRNDNVVKDSFLVNIDTDTWALAWNGTCTGKVYRQYEFDLITDISATVTLKNGSGTTVFSVTSDASSGAIATQTVSRGYYDQAHGDTLQDYGPFTLIITKAGKMPYTQTGIILTQKTNFLIQSRDQLSGTAAVGDVAATKTFYKDDADSKLTGTLALNGDADVGDVKVGKKFYKDNLTTQLTGTLDQSDATAAEADIALGKTAYVNFIKKTGTYTLPILSGDATAGDVIDGKTFYKDDVSVKLTGTLTFTGSASEAEVLHGYTFYATDPKTKKTGTLTLIGTAAAGDILQGKTAYISDPKTPVSGTLNPVSGGGPATVTVIKADPEEVVFVDGKPALLIDEKDPEIYTFIDKKKPISVS